MSLQQTYARLPITGEPVDGWFLVGALLVVLGVAGLLTGMLAPTVCGIAAVGAVVCLHLSGRERAPAGREPVLAPVSTPEGAARHSPA